MNWSNRLEEAGFRRTCSPFCLSPSSPSLSHPPLHNSVYRAVNFEEHRVAACKIVLLTPSTSEKERKNIEKEMRVHAALKHTNVLEFLNAVVVEPKHRDIYVPGIYMLLELAAGGDLFDKIGEWHIEALVGVLMDINDVSPRRGCW